MDTFPQGNALIYCQGAYATTNGKTAHGLVRRTRRYRVLSVIDARCEGADAGTLLDGRPRELPIFGSIPQAVKEAGNRGSRATHLVVGLAPDGGRFSPGARADMKEAIRLGLNVDSGLHDFLSEDAELVKLAEETGVRIRDVRKPPPRDALHFFSGKIEEVSSLKIALLGTDSAVGKRTTAWILLDALEEAGFKTELVGTGQTAWMQGVRYGIILDSLINDFISGEIEHAVWSAWNEARPEVIIIEGQGSLMNPAYPGGFEILAAGRPDIVILQHAPARKEYDGFPGYPIHSIEEQVRAIELISGKPVKAITVNRENLTEEEIPGACAEITRRTGLPACDVLFKGASPLVNLLEPYIKQRKA